MIKNTFRHSLLATAIVISLTACGGSDKKQIEALTASDVTLTDTKQWLATPYQLSVNKNVNLDQVRFFDGNLEVTESDGLYQFSHGHIRTTESGFEYFSLTGEDAKIGYQVASGDETASAQIIISDVESDPLVSEQWHLNNTGQTAFLFDQVFQDELIASLGEEEASDLITTFRDGKAIAGEDINVISAYNQGVLGNDMITVVVDSGVQIDHDDLVNNVLPGRSLDLARWSNDRDYPNDNGEGHGTSVAGIIAAQGWNGIGGMGVAPESKLIGMRYLQPSIEFYAYNAPYFDYALNAEMAAHGYPNSGISIDDPVASFNRSYGYGGLNQFYTRDEFFDDIEAYPANLRGGKGALNIKSAGNEFSWCDFHQELTCTNSNFSLSQSHFYYQNIAAIKANGEQSFYSNNGANLLVSAPAGEGGGFEPAIVTTDIMGCLDGLSHFLTDKLVDSDFYVWEYDGMPFHLENSFNYSAEHEKNRNCDYTNQMSGTSSAAPMVSGVVALILNANPDLTWREVKDILIRTANVNDIDDEKVFIDTKTGQYEAHSGWVENAANFKFNNRYGFGRVNAGEAVKLAKNYDDRMPELIESQWIDVSPQNAMVIPDNQSEGATLKFHFDEDYVIEAVRFKFGVNNTEFISIEDGIVQSTAGIDLAVEVVSPQKTKSILLSSHQAIIEDNWVTDSVLYDARMLTNAFYGENAKGEWEIRVMDVNDKTLNFYSQSYNNNQVNSELVNVSVQVYGHVKD